ncbi:uncharacterized protein LOC128896425 isoform X2 [Hylaeus anthracinus]|uniref:uncharacterized protein LOC128896425 isoform X2 n=1 Tax=Hylaeus anthracinus TaxID=313031 RepID=UPI0023B8903E|nr:uncharacterized protein LOC128896425 isoform X2 [Hylaeus anthracinus]
MDNRILKTILLSCESAWKDRDNSEEYQKLVRDDKFLPTSKNIFNAVCLSLTNLLTYKVSKEAYQRYTVRLHVIDVLRDWCTITDAFRNIRIFTDKKQTSTFLKNVLEKYLTNDVLDACDLSDNLLPLTSALMCLASTNPYYKHHVERLLLRLLELETSDESERLLCYAVQNSSDLNLELSTIENIYRLQRCKLIEQPLLNYFVSLCSDLNKDNNVDNSEILNLTKQLFEFAIMDFIQSTLNLLKKTCQGQGKDILDLYPRDLQSVVILLRIEPAYHTIDSKNATLRILKSIHSEDKNTVIVLMSHFPRWLKLFGELLCSYPDVKESLENL